MLGFSTYAALLPELRDHWALSNAEAGLIGSSFFVGYIATVSYWTAMTDRIDGRRIYLVGSLLAMLGGAGFGLAAQGLASAMLFQVLLGAGVAGTYMPGLRLLSDRVSGPASALRCRSRSRGCSRQRPAGARHSSFRRWGRCARGSWFFFSSGNPQSSKSNSLNSR